MLLSLESGVSALQQFQQNINVIANNIANVNTVGFKSGKVSFADTLSQTLGTSATGSTQVGTGVKMAGISNNFTNGTISGTGIQTDLAINGNGFFMVSDPITGNSYVTRDGEFKNVGGYLVNSSGMRLQGYTDGTLTTIGDIQIDNTGATTTDASGNTIPDTSVVERYSISETGKISVLLADGNTFTRGQILLQNFSSPEQLIKVGNNLYSGQKLAGALAAPVAPGSSGVGALATSSLESSNVDLAQQLTSLIVTQRAYEANSKVITTSDEILQTLVNLKR